MPPWALRRWSLLRHRLHGPVRGMRADGKSRQLLSRDRCSGHSPSGLQYGWNRLRRQLQRRDQGVLYVPGLVSPMPRGVLQQVRVRAQLRTGGRAGVSGLGVRRGRYLSLFDLHVLRQAGVRRDNRRLHRLSLGLFEQQRMCLFLHLQRGFLRIGQKRGRHFRDALLVFSISLRRLHTGAGRRA